MKVNPVDYLAPDEKTAFRTLLVFFAQALGRKFDEKHEQGRRGWANGSDPDLKRHLLESLRRHVDKGDMVDVGVLAAMIWNLEGDRCPQQKLEITKDGSQG